MAGIRSATAAGPVTPKYVSCCPAAELPDGVLGRSRRPYGDRVIAEPRHVVPELARELRRERLGFDHPTHLVRPAVGQYGGKIQTARRRSICLGGYDEAGWDRETGPGESPEYGGLTARLLPGGLGEGDDQRAIPSTKY